MSNLLESKTAVILGLANKWSIAHAIGQAFRREGAKLVITYQGERQRETVQELADELGAARIVCCDVSKDADLDALSQTLKEDAPIAAVVHSIEIGRAHV